MCVFRNIATDMIRLNHKLHCVKMMQQLLIIKLHVKKYEAR